MSILVSGGAGYIGSHTCIELMKAGYEILVADNLYNSCEEALRRVERIAGQSVPFVNIDPVSYTHLIIADGLPYHGDNEAHHNKAFTFPADGVCHEMCIRDSSARAARPGAPRLSSPPTEAAPFAGFTAGTSPQFFIQAQAHIRTLMLQNTIIHISAALPGAGLQGFDADCKRCPVSLSKGVRKIGNAHSLFIYNNGYGFLCSSNSVLL